MHRVNWLRSRAGRVKSGKARLNVVSNQHRWVRRSLAEELRRGQKRPLELGHAFNLEIADACRLHLPFRMGSGWKRTPDVVVDAKGN
jgi:hypothetical protein